MDRYRIVDRHHYACAICGLQFFSLSIVDKPESFFEYHINSYFHKKFMREAGSVTHSITWKRFLESGTCHLCRIDIPANAAYFINASAEQAFEAHVTTLRHSNKIKQINEELKPILRNSIVQKEIILSRQYCLICCISFKKQTALEQHLKSDAHEQNCIKFIKLEWTEDISNLSSQSFEDIAAGLNSLLSHYRIMSNIRVVDLANILSEVDDSGASTSTQPEPDFEMIAQLRECDRRYIRLITANNYECILCNVVVTKPHLIIHCNSRVHKVRNRSMGEEGMSDVDDDNPDDDDDDDEEESGNNDESGHEGPSGSEDKSGHGGPSGQAGPSGSEDKSGQAGPSGSEDKSGQAGPSGSEDKSGQAGQSGNDPKSDGDADSDDDDDGNGSQREPQNDIPPSHDKGGTKSENNEQDVGEHNRESESDETVSDSETFNPARNCINFIFDTGNSRADHFCFVCNLTVLINHVAEHIRKKTHVDKMKEFKNSQHFHAGKDNAIDNVLMWRFNTYKIKRASNRLYYCYACLTKFKTYSLVSHVKSSSHKKRCQGYHCKLFDVLKSDLAYTKPVEMNSRSGKCRLCHTDVSLINYEQHIRSKKHLSKFLFHAKSKLCKDLKITEVNNVPNFDYYLFKEILPFTFSNVICVLCLETLSIGENGCELKDKDNKDNVLSTHRKFCIESLKMKVCADMNEDEDNAYGGEETAVSSSKYELSLKVHSILDRKKREESGTTSRTDQFDRGSSSGYTAQDRLTSALYRNNNSQTNSDSTDLYDIIRSYVRGSLENVRRQHKCLKTFYCEFCDVEGDILSIYSHFDDEFHDMEMYRCAYRGGRVKILNCSLCKVSICGSQTAINHYDSPIHKQRKEEDIAAKMAVRMYEMTRVESLVIQDAASLIINTVKSELNKYGLVKDVKIVKRDLVVEFVKPGVVQNIVQLKKIKVGYKTYKVNKIMERGRIKYHVHNMSVELLEDPEKLTSRGKILTEKANKFKQNPKERQKEEIVFNFLNSIVSSQYTSCQPFAFGSRLTGLTLDNSDLDVFLDCDGVYYGIDACQTPKYQENIVKSIYKLLVKNTECRHVQMVPRARVPIVVFEHKSTGIKCDVSFKNGLSVQNSKLILFYLEHDERIKPYILILKEWFSYNKLQGTPYFSSYAISMMAIFYLQQLNPPVLPTVEYLQYLDKKNPIYINSWKCSFCNEHDRVPKSNNNSTVWDLVKGFFNFYSTYNFKDNIVAPLTGKNLRRTTLFKLDRNIQRAYHPYLKELVVENFLDQFPICVMDPFDLSHNLTKSFTFHGFELFLCLCSSSALIMNNASEITGS